MSSLAAHPPEMPDPMTIASYGSDVWTWTVRIFSMKDGLP